MQQRKQEGNNDKRNKSPHEKGSERQAGIIAKEPASSRGWEGSGGSSSFGWW